MQTLELVDAVTGVDFGDGVHLDTRTAGTSERLALVLPGAERVAEDAAFLDALGAEYTVVSPSHPGFGLSPRPEWCGSVDDLARLYLDWLDRTDARDVTLIGLQFGGWVALEMAARSTRRIGRLVLVDTVGVKLGGPTDREIADVFATGHDRLEALYYADPSRHGLGDLGRAGLTDVLEMARNDEALATYGWQPYLHTPGLARRLASIDVPTLVVWGEYDGVVAPAYGRGIAERIPGADFAEIAGAAHRPQAERPAETAAVILGSAAGSGSAAGA